MLIDQQDTRALALQMERSPGSKDSGSDNNDIVCDRHAGIIADV